MEVRAKENQTLLDFCIEYYGTIEAIGEVLVCNPSLKNDTKSLIEAGYPPLAFHLEIMLDTSQIITIDEQSQLMKKNVIKNIDRPVTTYTTKQWQEQLNK